MSGLYGTNPDSNLKTQLGVVAAKIIWSPAGGGHELTLRGELWHLDNLAPDWAITPAVTYWPNPAVFVRGNVEHSRDVNNVTHDRLSIQVVFSMGPHKNEAF